MRVPLPPFEPDKSQFNTAASSHALNVLPVADGWGPMPGLLEVTDALPAECRGAAYVLTSAGTYRIIAATATAIYSLDVTDFTWDDISGPSAPYSIGDDETWSFTRFGNQLLIHNINDPIQVMDIEAGGAVADLAGSPPKARYSWVAGDFLVLGSIEGTAGERTVHWSGLNDATHWTIGKKSSDKQELPEGDEIMGGFADTGGFVVLQRSGMQFFPFALDSGFTFTRQVLNPKQGTCAPRSIVSLGPGRFFYLSNDGFFGGANREPIGAERVDRWFQAAIDLRYIDAVQGAADPYEKIVWWKYRLVDGTYARIGYDWQLDRWCTSNVAIGEMLALETPSLTWDGLDDFYATISAVPVPFDSRVFSGGAAVFAAFSPANKLAYFTGPNSAAEIDTAWFEPSATNRTYINEARAITDAGSLTITDTVAAYHGGPQTSSAAQAPHPRSWMANFRSDGRLHKMRLAIPSGTDWSIAQAIEVSPLESGAI